MPLVLVNKGNEAVAINAPTTADLHITAHGSDWLWAAFSIFIFVCICHTGLFLFKGKKSLSSILAIISCFVMSFTYFTYASNLGWAGVYVEFFHVTVSDPLSSKGFLRQIFYAKFIGWFVAFPFVLALFEYVGHGSLLSNLSLTSFNTYCFNIFLVEVTVLGLLIGSIVHSTYKWGYFTFAVVAQLALIGSLNFHAFKRYTFSNLNKLNILVLNIVLILYPVAWGLCEGGNVIQPDSEAVFYGILDLCTFCFFPTILSFQDEAASFKKEELPAAGNHAAETKELEPEVPRASGETAV